MTPAIAIFDVAKGFRRRYFDFGGTELADQKRDDLLILDSNRFHVGYGDGTLFRISRIAADPMNSTAAFGAYCAMPSSFQLRTGGYYGGALFASPRDEPIVCTLESLERLARQLGESIETLGPHRWDIGNFQISGRELGLAEQHRGFPDAPDRHWMRSDESAFVDLAGMDDEEFLALLQDGLSTGSVLPRYANLFFSFDGAMVQSILGRGLANPRTPEQIFSPARQTAIEPAPVFQRPTNMGGTSGDLLRSRPVRQSTISAIARPKTIRERFAERIADAPNASSARYVALLAGILVLSTLLGSNLDWLTGSQNDTPARPQLDQTDRTATVPSDPVDSGLDTPAAIETPRANQTLPEAVAIPARRVADRLTELRRMMADDLDDPAFEADDHARALIQDFIARIDKELGVETNRNHVE